VEGQPRRPTRPSIIAGQILASGYTAFFLAIVIGEEIAGEGNGATWEGIGLVVLMVFASASALAAWVVPSLGSRLLIASGIAMAGFVAVSAGGNRIAAAALLSAPYLISALAIWFGARRLSRGDGPVARA
jgi:hypothetical protein